MNLAKASKNMGDNASVNIAKGRVDSSKNVETGMKGMAGAHKDVADADKSIASSIFWASAIPSAVWAFSLWLSRGGKKD